MDFGRSERCLSALLGRDGLLFNGESHGTGPSDSNCTRRDLSGSQDEQIGRGSMSMKTGEENPQNGRTVEAFAMERVLQGGAT